MTIDLTAGAIAGASASSGYEPQRINHWQLRVSDAPGAGTEGLQLAIRTCPLPTGSNEPIPIMKGNEAVKVAGRFEQEGLSLSFMDFVDKNILGLLWAWRNLVYNRETGAVGLASVYKKEALLTLAGPDGNTEREYQLQGIWPSTDPAGDLDQSGNEPLIVAVEFSVDKADYLNVA